MIRVLFVCLGNICRSPMAEAIFRDLVIKEGLDKKIAVDSAGTGSWHVGEVPHEGTRKKLDEYNIDYSSIRARQIKKDDIFSHQYIIAMDEQNIKDVKKMTNENSTAYIAKLLHFTEDTETTDVPDPYFTGNFDVTYALVKKGCEGLLHFIRNRENL